jgi:hypothetical protein
VKYNLQRITDAIQNNPGLLMDDLGLDLKKYGERYEGPCPIHSGSKKTAFNIYIDRNKYYCFTKGCQDATHNTLIGFVRMCLSVRYSNWRRSGDSLYSFRVYA